MVSSADFEKELDLFRTEHQAAIQFFYAWRTINSVASRDKTVVNFLDNAPLMWNTILGGLQTSTFIALGRVFDVDRNAHSLTRLLSLAHENLNLFSKESVAARKCSQSAMSADQLEAYLETIYVPTSKDFRRLKQHVRKRRVTYETKYRPIRHKVFAHREMLNADQVSTLFALTNVAELEKLLAFLARIYDALWQLYFNGIKPSLRPIRFSVENILRQPVRRGRRRTIQERMVVETRSFLKVNSQ